MYSIIYFSPTGNAKHLAEKLAANLSAKEENVLPLEFTNPETLRKNTHLVLLYPMHGFNAPKTVKRFVKALPEKKFQSISLLAVGTAGNWLNEAASLDLRKMLKKKNYPIVVDKQLVMPLTLAINTPDDWNRERIKESEQAMEQIGDHIKNEVPTKKKVPYKSKVVNFLGKAEAPAARLFGLELHANNDCTQCGTCWNNCPQQNIKQNNKGKPKFGFNCIMCMRCIYECPEQAISPRISKFIPIKGSYSLSKYITK